MSSTQVENINGMNTNTLHVTILFCNEIL